MPFIYIIHSSKWNRYYIGSTQDIDQRLKDHNAGRTKSTKHGKPWTMVYFEKFDTLQQARAREAELKRKKSRKYLEFLISSKK